MIWGMSGIPTYALRTAKEKLLSLTAMYESFQNYLFQIGSVQGLGPFGDEDDGSHCNGIRIRPRESLLVSQHNPTSQNQESVGYRQVGNDKHSEGDACLCPLGREVSS